MVNEAPVCGAGVVCMRGQAVLLVRRAKPPLLGQWSLPGGKIAWGETAQAAALRELKEETGVDAEIVGLIDVVDAIFPPAGPAASHHLLVDFAARWTAGEPRPGDDASAAAFRPLTEAIAAVEWSETRRIIAAGAAILEALG
jgi:8-oxo-dGTP diphosphatase